MSANSIKEVSFPDGKPILVNILLGNRYEKCYFPVHELNIDAIDNESLLLISSLFGSELKAINEKLVHGAFNHWGREIGTGARLMIGGDNNSILNTLVGFPLWFHLRGVE